MRSDTDQRPNVFALLVLSALACIAGWVTLGSPDATLCIVVSLGAIACFFVPRRQLKRFIFCSILGLGISVCGTQIAVAVRHGAVTNYSESARSIAAVSNLLAATIPCGAILGGAIGVLYPAKFDQSD
ncbi:MAG: hypothetical protein AB8G99_18135 [Planctomycetaceae bacterium]